MPVSQVGPGEPEVCLDSVSSLKDRLRYLTNHAGFRAQPVRTVLRLAEWRCRSVLGMGARIRLGDGAQLCLPGEWRGVAKLLYAFRSRYERELLYLVGRLRPGMVFADIGASYGVYTLLAARAVGPEGLVLAFEPSQRTFDILKKNVGNNRLRNVLLFRTALAESRGTGALLLHPDPSRNSLCRRSARPASVIVPVETLDGVLRTKGIGRLDAIKMDVEGAEALVLAGASKTLERFRPFILFEVNGGACAALGLSTRDAWEILAAHGYRFFVVGPCEELHPLSGPSEGNIFALPSEMV